MVEQRSPKPKIGVRFPSLLPINICCPGRFHLIVRPGFFYITLNVWRRRLHFCRPELPYWETWLES